MSGCAITERAQGPLRQPSWGAGDSSLRGLGYNVPSREAFQPRSPSPHHYDTAFEKASRIIRRYRDQLGKDGVIHYACTDFTVSQLAAMIARAFGRSDERSDGLLIFDNDRAGAARAVEELRSRTLRRELAR